MQVVNICRKIMVQKKDDGVKPKGRYLSQGQSTRSNNLLDIDSVG